MSPLPVPFSLNAVPEIHFGPGRGRALSDGVRAVSAATPGAPAKVLLVADAALVELGLVAPLRQGLEADGADVGLYSDIAGEPKAAQIDAAAEAARRLGAGVVIALGGGSALDIGKVAAAIAPAAKDAMHYALAANPLPGKGLPAICLPTTAGTGSELSATNIFAGPAGKKLWIWGQETKPQRVILDPELTLSLPPQLTAWTGLDAFVHALEACTNRYANAGNSMTCHKALTLIAGALETAVQQPDNLAAPCCSAPPSPASASTTAAPRWRTTSPTPWPGWRRCTTAWPPRWAWRRRWPGRSKRTPRRPTGGNSPPRRAPAASPALRSCRNGTAT